MVSISNMLQHLSAAMLRIWWRPIVNTLVRCARILCISHLSCTLWILLEAHAKACLTSRTKFLHVQRKNFDSPVVSGLYPNIVLNSAKGTTTPPAPVKMRQNSWVSTVIIHSSNFEHCLSLLSKVQERYDEAAQIGLLLQLLDKNHTELMHSVRFIAAFGRKLPVPLKATKDQWIASHEVYNALFILWGYLR